MSKRSGVEDPSKVSIDKIIDNIRITRNDKIQKLLVENALMVFLKEQFEVVVVSAIKLEFLKRDLQELKKSSLDLTHYASLIKLLKESNIDTPLDDDPLFKNELILIFQKYIVSPAH